jgi:nucleotidyltransferase substrate binding protein (TIGR01987 family)
MYGLTEEEFYQLINILKAYSKDIEWVKIFGSRARGDHKKTSDIDLAISFKKDKLLEIKDDFYNAVISHMVDIIDYNKNTNENLKNFIDKEGKIIFLTDEKGKIIMNENKLKYKLDDFERALKRLEDSLNKDPHLDDLYLDGTIQRFEFVFELSWKLMKGYLEYNGIEVSSPRESFRQSFKNSLLEDAAKWIKMMENRNRTSHTYNLDTAWEIYGEIKEEYIYLFKEFYEIIKLKIEECE